jgi:hypothetical protein
MSAILSVNGPGTPTLDELYAIADATGVPRWFMDAGWDGRPSYVALVNELRRELTERVDALEAGQRRISREILDVGQAVGARPRMRPVPDVAS